MFVGLRPWLHDVCVIAQLEMKRRATVVCQLSHHLPFARTPSAPSAQLCRGVVVHAFSNGGALVYAEILKRARGRPTAFLGAVLDSCPGSISSVASGARAFLATRPSALSLAAVGSTVIGEFFLNVPLLVHFMRILLTI